MTRITSTVGVYKRGSLIKKFGGKIGLLKDVRDKIGVVYRIGWQFGSIPLVNRRSIYKFQ